MDAIKITLENIAPISIPYKGKEPSIMINYSVLEPVCSLEVSGFPNFVKVGIRESQGLIRANFAANVRVQSLLTDMDEFYSIIGSSTIADMDKKTLSELDIKENIDIYSIS